MIDNLEDKVTLQQKELCIKYKADFCLSSFDSIIGVALDTFDQSKVPVNGLRHTIENESVANWHIWVGEYFISK